MAGIYVHIPFCLKKCYYCDFVSFAGEESRFELYTKALIKEIRQCEAVKNERIDSVFLGGGTPTVFPVSCLKEIMDLLCSFNIDSDCEFTIEANPGTINLNLLKELRSIGFNRLSIGLQAWQNGLLKKIGRIHTAQIFEQNYEQAVKAGFDNINVDIMFSLPGQTISDFHETVEKVISLNPKHISAYGLIIEKGTQFERMYENGIFTEASEETDRQMYNAAVNTLMSKGFLHYEISNFAIPGYSCRHNVNVWNCGNYFGFGLNAHSYNNGFRYCNTSDLPLYLSGGGLRASEEKINIRMAMDEFMFLGLRLIEGVNIDQFMYKFNKDIFDIYGKTINDYLDTGYLALENRYLRLTYNGISVSNIILADFITL